MHIYTSNKLQIYAVFFHTVVCTLATLATRPLRARYAPATRPLRARYAPSIYMCGSPKTRRYLLNKSSNTIIWRLNIRQVNKDLYVEVESHARLSITEKMCGSVQTTV